MSACLNKDPSPCFPTVSAVPPFLTADAAHSEWGSANHLSIVSLTYRRKRSSEDSLQWEHFKQAVR